MKLLLARLQTMLAKWTHNSAFFHAALALESPWHGLCFFAAAGNKRPRPPLRTTSILDHLQEDGVMSTLKASHRQYMPTPAEINRRAAEVRKSWTPEVRASRRRLARAYQALLSSSSRSAA
jgi:hypothetical protein